MVFLQEFVTREEALTSEQQIKGWKEERSDDAWRLG
jgi:predicted GIY-YIG superfamily endonuclease